MGLQGNITIDLKGPVTIGTLNAGDKGGSPGVSTTIGGGEGRCLLMFEGTRPARPRPSISPRAQARQAGDGLNIASGIRLGGTSPLTATVASAARLNFAIGDLDLNGNTITIVGPQRIIDGRINTGVNWQVSTIAGKGNYVLNGAGTHLLKTCPDFTGTLTVNNGWFVAETTGLPKVSEYVIAGAFTNHREVSPRRQGPDRIPLPCRLEASRSAESRRALVFKGGYLGRARGSTRPSRQGGPGAGQTDPLRQRHVGDPHGQRQ